MTIFKMISGVPIWAILFLVLLAFFVGYYLSKVISITISNIFGAPNVSSSDQKIEQMLRLGAFKKGQRVVDLGSGEGKVVMALAKRGIKAVGFEINPFLVFWSSRQIKKAGLEGKATIYRKNLFEVDLKEFDGVVVFGIPWIMERLERKLKKELKKGGEVVSNGFAFPNWRYVKREGEAYLYINS